MSSANRAGATVAGDPVGSAARRQRIDRVIELILAMMLGAVALATAWSGYQAARWGGIQSIALSQAAARRAESARASTKAGQHIQIDVGTFSNWVAAFAVDEAGLAEFYEGFFRDEFRPAFDAWMAMDPANNPAAPPTPFEMPEYQVSNREEADRLELEAEMTFEEGRAANAQSDKYVLNAVILASVLFMAGIASGFDWLPVRIAIIVSALVLLVLGLYNLGVYPVA
jgi:hypothetical protein